MIIEKSVPLNLLDADGNPIPEDPVYSVYELTDALDANGNSIQIRSFTGQHTRSHIISHITDLQTELQYWQDFLTQADAL